MTEEVHFICALFERQKHRFRLDARKFALSHKVVNDWDSLSSQRVNCCTVNTLKKHLSVELEPETAKL